MPHENRIDSLKEFTKTITVKNELGLHARPAALIAKKAQDAKSNIWMIKEGVEVDASSIIDILSLACVKGTEISLRIDSSEDFDIINDIAVFIEDGAGE